MPVQNFSLWAAPSQEVGPNPGPDRTDLSVSFYLSDAPKNRLRADQRRMGKKPNLHFEINIEKQNPDDRVKA